MDYVGSLLGALLFTYVLLRVMSVVRIGFALGMVNVCLGIVGCGLFSGADCVVSGRLFLGRVILGIGC